MLKLKKEFEDHIADGHPFGGGVPVGSIVIWYSEDIPDGWALCNGLGGTPNLSYKFIYGSAFSHQVGNSFTFASTFETDYTGLYVNFIIKL